MAAALRLSSPDHIRRFGARLINQLRNGGITQESAAIQNEVARTILMAMAQQPAAELEAEEEL